MEQGHALIGFLRHSINIPDKENPFAFTAACTVRKGCGTSIFLMPAMPKCRGAQSGVSQSEEASQGFVGRNKHVTWKHTPVFPSLRSDQSGMWFRSGWDQPAWSQSMKLFHLQMTSQTVLEFSLLFGSHLVRLLQFNKYHEPPRRSSSLDQHSNTSFMLHHLG